MISKARRYLALLGAFAITAVIAWFKGRSAGAAFAEGKRDRARLEAINEANEVRNEVEALDRDSLQSRARRWVRGPDR